MSDINIWTEDEIKFLKDFKDNWINKGWGKVSQPKWLRAETLLSDNAIVTKMDCRCKIHGVKDRVKTMMKDVGGKIDKLYDELDNE